MVNTNARWLIVLKGYGQNRPVRVFDVLTFLNNDNLPVVALFSSEALAAAIIKETTVVGGHETETTFVESPVDLADLLTQFRNCGTNFVAFDPAGTTITDGHPILDAIIGFNVAG